MTQPDWHSAREIVGKLKGRWSGSSGASRCPAHDDRSPSLSVTQTRDGRVLVKCFAGCPQDAVIGALRRLNLWPQGSAVGDPSYPGYLTTPLERTYKERGERESRADALDIWDHCKPAKDTAVEEYLRARGIKLPISDQLRYAPRLKHSQSGQSLRAMVARISDSRGFCAVQRTFLDNNVPKKADVKPNKMSKGPMGEGAVRLREPGEVLGLAEGIETAYSAMQIYQITTWATLSANRLGKIEIPAHVRSLVIFADSGEVGRAQAFAAADNYEALGISSEVILPGADFKDATDDFNTVLQEASHG